MTLKVRLINITLAVNCDGLLASGNNSGLLEPVQPLQLS